MDVRTRFPLTLALLGPEVPSASSVETFVTDVCAAHAKGDIPSRGVRDLVRFEALVSELPERSAPLGGPPRDDERLVLAPDVRVLVYGADLPGMLAALRAGKPPRSRPARGWLIFWREQGKLHERFLTRETGWMLESFREPQLVSDAVEDDEDREALAEFCRLGVLTRAP